MDNYTSFEYEDVEYEELLQEVEEFGGEKRSFELFGIIFAIVERLLGLFFNLFFIRALWSLRKHTSTYFLLINLSIVDIIVCSLTILVILADVHLNEQIFGTFMCKTVASVGHTLENLETFALAAALVGLLVKPNLSVLKMKQGIILMWAIAILTALPIMIFTISIELLDHKRICVFLLESILIKYIFETGNVLIALLSIVLYMFLPNILRKTFIKTKVSRLLFGVVIFDILFSSPRVVITTLNLFEFYVYNDLVILFVTTINCFGLISRPLVYVWLDEEIRQHVLTMIRRSRRENSFAESNDNEV